MIDDAVSINPPPVRPDPPYRITSPIIVHTRADIASLLRAHRMSLNWTCEELDARAGFSDRYVTKMEHGDKPKGRKGFIITPPSPVHPAGDIRSSFMADVWLDTMGLKLVLLPEETARAIGAVPAPVKDDKRSKALSELAALDGETL